MVEQINRNAAKDRGQTLRLRPIRARSGMVASTQTTYPNYPQECFICGVTSCKLITHRMSTLDVLRRSAKSDTKTKKDVEPARLVPALTCTPRRNINSVDPFTPFPVNEAKTSVILYFNVFFKAQGGDMQDTNRGLTFDNAYHPWLFPAAMQNPALCMSCVAMSATYVAVHGRNLTEPDAELLSVYGQCFEVLRKQIASEHTSAVSEASIMAAINLVMCCGVGFSDSSAAITHWNGVTAMWEKADPNMYRGALIGLFDHLEYWLTLMVGRRFRQTPWRTAIPQEKPLAEIYGKGFERLFASQTMTSSTPKLLATCLNTCRATEALEGHLQSLPLGSDKTPSTYFQYLRNVLNGQNAQIYADFSGTNTFEECISIAVNIFFLLILRTTPWRAPIKQLCTKLCLTITACGLTSSVSALSSNTIDEGYSEEEESDTLLNDAYVWMLFLCACAAKSCRDEASFDWSKDRLRETYVHKLSSDLTEFEILIPQRLRLFCWSNKFLTRRLKDICSSIAPS